MRVTSTEVAFASNIRACPVSHQCDGYVRHTRRWTRLPMPATVLCAIPVTSKPVMAAILAGQLGSQKPPDQRKQLHLSADERR